MIAKMKNPKNGKFNCIKQFGLKKKKTQVKKKRRKKNERTKKKQKKIIPIHISKYMLEFLIFDHLIFLQVFVHHYISNIHHIYFYKLHNNVLM